MGMTRIARVFSMALIVGVGAAGGAPCLPFITGIDFTATTHGKRDNTYVATITGRHFGPAPAGVPCTACSPNELQVVDMDAAKWPETINVTAWNDNAITISGVSAKSKESLIIDVYNDTLGNAGARGQSATGHTLGPHITAISAQGSGQSLQVTIAGSGFGPAPAQVGQNTNSPYLMVTDFNNATTGTGGAPWHAGFCGAQQCDGVTMGYVSWSDTQIVMSGFGPDYGQSDWLVNSGDAYCVTVWSTNGDGAGSDGATSRCARLP
jgi:hypothetical protein